MIYSEFQGKQLSLLGFGAMRLPTLADGSIDEAQVRDMVAHAMSKGVNYYDTAWPYHNGESERVMGGVLGEYERGSFYLATKFPGHQISESYDPAAIFEAQLKKCGVEYFDFYLLHNVYENSINTYLDPKWGIIDYFREQKRLGRIKHLGFSSHGSIKVMERFLDACDDMEFCQIQLNYLDWTLQDAKKKCEMLASRNIPVWVMEPVRGGRLVQLSDDELGRLKGLRPEESAAAWAFRFIQDIPGVKVVLSGMSDMAQMVENAATFDEPKPLSQSERELLLDIAEGMKNAIPCTACRYCCDTCPAGLDIPGLIAIYNDLKFSPSINVAMRVEAFRDDAKPSACVGCRKCSQVCPQGIDVSGIMRDFDEMLKTMPSWAEVSRQREAAQK